MQCNHGWALMNTDKKLARHPYPFAYIGGSFSGTFWLPEQFAVCWRQGNSKQPSKKTTVSRHFWR